jgi:hypothetical protein
MRLLRAREFPGKLRQQKASVLAAPSRRAPT